MSTRLAMGNKQMKKLKSAIAASLVVIGGFIFCLCPSSTVTSRVDAANNPRPNGNPRRGNDKISDEFRGRLNSTELVQVILQLNSPRTGRLNALLQRNGIHLKDEFKELHSFVVELPVSVLSELAQFDEVQFISPDREVRLFGHVETTTGAAFMRLQSGNSGYKGKDTNIALLDSGIDKDHHEIGGRVDAQIDFTGEGRVDDPYGHGTHVASLATGIGHVAKGTYTGVAPEAKIINLRVLNADGVGAVSNVMKALNWIIAPADPTKPSGDKNFQKYKIRVVNMSLGAPAVDSSSARSYSRHSSSSRPARRAGCAARRR